jgi:hypothetical protein
VLSAVLGTGVSLLRVTGIEVKSVGMVIISDDVDENSESGEVTTGVELEGITGDCSVLEDGTPVVRMTELLSRTDEATEEVQL